MTLRRSSQESNSSDSTELPAVTVSSAPPLEFATVSGGSTPPAVNTSPRPSLTVPELVSEPTPVQENNNSIHTANIIDSR